MSKDDEKPLSHTDHLKAGDILKRLTSFDYDKYVDLDAEGGLYERPTSIAYSDKIDTLLRSRRITPKAAETAMVVIFALTKTVSVYPRPCGGVQLENDLLTIDIDTEGDFEGFLA